MPHAEETWPRRRSYLGVRVTAEEAERVTEVAAQRRVSRSALLRELLAPALQPETTTAATRQRS